MVARQAVVVLGMHRSGTSAVAGTASRFGLALPRTPLPASGDNPCGFCESLPVVTTNHQILQAAGCAWNVCLTFEPEWLAGMLTPVNRQFLSNLLRDEFGDTEPFVFKDPRLCLTLPAWLPALNAVGASIRVLIVARHPADVVQSLAVRNHLPEAETAPHWLHHMLEAERATRRMQRAVVLYDDLMRGWRGCMATASRIAGLSWPRSMALSEAEIDRFLDPWLRHHRSAHDNAVIGPAPVGQMVEAAWIAFRHLAREPGNAAALTGLDDVRMLFANWRHANFPAGLKAIFPPT